MHVPKRAHTRAETRAHARAQCPCPWPRPRPRPRPRLRQVVNPRQLEGVRDNTALFYLGAPHLLHNLRVRHLTDQFQTYTGQMVIVTNPFKNMERQACSEVFLFGPFPFFLPPLSFSRSPSSLVLLSFSFVL